MILAFSIIGAIGSVFIPFPQAKKAYFYSTQGVSATTYITLCAIAVIWIPHGIFIDSPLLSLSNFVASLFCVVIIYSISRDNHNRSLILCLFIVVGTSLAAYLFFNDALRTALILLVVGFLRFPQLYKSIFAKDIHGVSVLTWVIAVACNCSWFVVAILKEDLQLTIATTFSIVMSALIALIASVRQHRLSALTEGA